MPSEKLDPLAVAKANDALWTSRPELGGRQLSLGPDDAPYRQEWLRHYRQVKEATPAPPPPRVVPQPVEEPPPPVDVTSPIQPCPNITAMTHREKMTAAYKMALDKLPEQAREELPDPAVFVGILAVTGGLLATATVATGGVAALAGGFLVGLAVLGAAFTGGQIGQAINGVMDFYDKTRCDRATSPEDLDSAATSLADAVAKAGVGAVTAVVSRGAAKIAGKAKTRIPRRWKFGDHKKLEKFQRQMKQRGWMESQIDEAMVRGEQFKAPNNVNPANGATRYVHPGTGRSVVVDDVTGELLHVGGDGFKY